jgi:hypothetical protein
VSETENQPVTEPAQQPDEYGTLAAVGRILRRDTGTCKSIALAGAIRVRAIAGSRIQYHLGDARKLAAE